MCYLIVYVLSVLCYSYCYYTKSVLPIMLNKIQFKFKFNWIPRHIRTNLTFIFNNCKIRSGVRFKMPVLYWTNNF